jgi:hypothetical protein
MGDRIFRSYGAVMIISIRFYKYFAPTERGFSCLLGSHNGVFYNQGFYEYFAVAWLVAIIRRALAII